MKSIARVPETDGKSFVARQDMVFHFCACQLSQDFCAGVLSSHTCLRLNITRLGSYC